VCRDTQQKKIFFKIVLQSALPGTLGKENIFLVLCRVLSQGHLAMKIFFLEILCRVPCYEALGKKIIFLEILCQVPPQALGKLTRTNLFFFFFTF